MNSLLASFFIKNNFLNQTFLKYTPLDISPLLLKFFRQIIHVHIHMHAYFCAYISVNKYPYKCIIV